MEKITRAEAESIVRLSAKVCKGLPVLSTEVRHRLHTKWLAITVIRDWEAAIALVTEAKQEVVKAVDLNHPFGGNQPVAFNDWETLWREAAQAIFAYGNDVGKPCGYDFNNEFCAHPFDGKEHLGKCPLCGNEVPFTSPVFDVADEKEERI